MRSRDKERRKQARRDVDKSCLQQRVALLEERLAETPEASTKRKCKSIESAVATTDLPQVDKEGHGRKQVIAEGFEKEYGTVTTGGYRMW